MKVLQYNIWDGCQDEGRFAKFDRWIQKQDYDVIGFNELNSWTAEGLQDQANRWGYPYSCLFEMESSPYFIGMIAKSPIERIKFIEEDPIYHGLLHVRIKGIHFFITHLSPFESGDREREAEYIGKCIAPIRNPLVVMGDFNTPSPLDRDYYDRTYPNMDKASQFNYRPMQILLDAGLHDTYSSDSFNHSIPTHLKLEEEKNVRFRRIDYVLVNEMFLEHHPVSTIIHDFEVEMLSDHYPVECHWDEF